MTSVTFTSSGSWAAAASAVDCQAWAEGGNGGTSAHGSRSGGGGGGGEYAEETVLLVSGTITFTIGSGGTSANTSFPGTSVTVTANFGVNAPGQSPGSGGTGSSNSIHFSGGNGGTGLTNSNTGGAGGGGSGGSGGAGGTGGGGTAGGGAGGTAGSGSGAAGGAGGANSANGNNGNAPGSGAGGGGSGGSLNHTGGAGAGGQITLIYNSAVSGTATLDGVGTLTAAGSIAGLASLSGVGTLTAIRSGSGNAALHGIGTLAAGATQRSSVSLSGVGTLAAAGGSPAPAIVNQWASNYGQGTTFPSIGPALQSCVTQLTPAFSVGVGSGVATPGNWLFCIASWTQDPSIANAHVGVGDDIHSYWRQRQASSGTGWSFTVSGTPVANSYFIASTAQAASISVGNIFTDTSNPGENFEVTAIGAPAFGFQNISFNPPAAVAMNTPDVVTQETAGITRTSISYTPNIARSAGRVYVAPDAQIAAINVLVVEISGLGPWDTVTGTNYNYAAAATSLPLSLGTPPRAAFFIGATGGDNVSSGQAFLPSGWTALATQTQTNGSNHLADNILTAAILPSSTLSQSVSGTSSSQDMSGYLLAVEVSADSPIPLAQNPNWPFLKFYAGFGSGFDTPDSEIDWTDLTSRLWNYDETSGIQFQLQELQAANVELQADNFDYALTSTNVNSPYYPNVIPGTPLQLRMALGTMGGQVINRWYILQRNAQEWTEKIDEQFRPYVDITATDLWNALSSTPPTFYRAEVTEDSPYAWWPLDDAPGTAGVLPVQMLNAAIGNTSTLNVRLSPNGAVAEPVYDTDGNNLSGGISGGLIAGSIAVYTVGANSGWMFGDPVSSPASTATGNSVSSQPGSASWQQSGNAGNTGSFGWYLICNDNNFPALSSGITVEGWFNYQFFGSSTGYTPSGQSGFAAACQQPFCALTLMELATASNPVAILQMDISGHLNLITYNGSTPTSHSVYSASDMRSASWFMVTMTMTATSWTVWINGGATAQVSGSASMTSAWTYLIVNADFGSGGGTSPAGVVHSGNASVSHIAVYPYILPYYRVMDHYWAAVTSFGQLPAPTAPAIQWVGPAQLGGSSGFPPDGSVNFGSYTANSNPSASAIVVANVSGFTSGPSAWAVGTAFNPSGSEWYVLWVGWQGVASSFDLYTSAALGSETEASVVAGSGDAFTSGYGAGASGQGVAHVSGGSGSAPPSAPSSIGDTVGNRIERLMGGGLYSSPKRCVDQAPLLVNAPGTTGGGSQTGSAIQAIQQSDDGMLYVDNCGNLTYWERPHLASQYTSPVWLIGPSTGKIPYYVQVNWVTDPQRVQNVITISPLSPTGAALPLITPSSAPAANASQAQYGAQPLQVTSYLQSMTEMQSQANWLLEVFGVPRRRAESVFIDAGPDPLAWQLVLGINVGDVVTLEDWVIGGGGAVYTMRVTEIKRRLDFGSHNQPVTGQVTLTLDYEATSYWS